MRGRPSATRPYGRGLQWCAGRARRPVLPVTKRNRVSPCRWCAGRGRGSVLPVTKPMWPVPGRPHRGSVMSTAPGATFGDRTGGSAGCQSSAECAAAGFAGDEARGGSRPEGVSSSVPSAVGDGASGVELPCFRHRGKRYVAKRSSDLQLSISRRARARPQSVTAEHSTAVGHPSADRTTSANRFGATTRNASRMMPLTSSQSTSTSNLTPSQPRCPT